MRLPRGLLITLAAFGLACATESNEDQSEAGPAYETFWASIQSLCGNAYAGSVVESVPPDSTMSNARLVMHVASCSEDEIRIPFFVDDDRSRTWVITRVSDGLQLKHDHRHEDGTEDDVSQYGGTTGEPGTAMIQEFAADQFTAELVPLAATNIWALEVLPGNRFVYALRRLSSDRKFRAEFDLTREIDTPPAPW